MASYILSTHEDAFVYAGARNPDKATALEDLKSEYPSQLAIIECVAGDIAGNAEAVKEIEERHGHVDTVIACVGKSVIGNCFQMRANSRIALIGVACAFGKVDEVSVSDMENHFRVCYILLLPVIIRQNN